MTEREGGNDRVRPTHKNNKQIGFWSSVDFIGGSLIASTHFHDS